MNKLNRLYSFHRKVDVSDVGYDWKLALKVQLGGGSRVGEK